MRHRANTRSSSLLVLVLLLAADSSTAAKAQPTRETIPEAMARGSSGRTRTAPSGKSPTVAEILADADVVVRATIGEARSYLSEDKRDVYTDYQLLKPVFLYQRKAVTSPKPGPTGVTVTQLGGKIAVGNLEFTQTELGLPLLVPGTEGIFILKSQGGKYHIAHTFYGAFIISNNTVMPLTSKHDFAPDYRGAPAATVLADLTSRLRAVR